MLCAQQHRWVVMRHSACFFFFFFFITKKICRAVSGTAKSPRSATTNCAPAMWMSETLYWGECSTSSLNENTTFSHRQLQQVQIQIRHNTQQERKGHLKHNKSATNWTTWLLKKKNDEWIGGIWGWISSSEEDVTVCWRRWWKGLQIYLGKPFHTEAVRLFKLP